MARTGIYCDDNPANKTDPTGRMSMPVSLWLDILGEFLGGVAIKIGLGLIEGGVYLGLGASLAALGWAIVIGVGILTIYELNEYIGDAIKGLIDRQRHSAGLAMAATSNLENVVAMHEAVLEILVASIDDD